MPPRLGRDRDPRVTRITRADARANPAVQAAVNANVLAARGLADPPTAEETAAIEETVVEDRNNRPPPPPKTKNPKTPGTKPTGITKVGPKKKESKKAKFERRQKEKAAAAKVAAAAAAVAEKAEAAAAIEAVEAAKALEAVKVAEALEAAKKNGGTGTAIVVDEKGKKPKSNSGKKGGPPTPSNGSDTGSSSSGGGPDKISGSELERRLKGVDWEKLGEKLTRELYKFVRRGGTVAEWEKKRAEKEELDKLTEKIGYVSSEEEIDDVSEDENDVYEDPEGGTEPEGENENDEYEDPEGENEPEGETGPEDEDDDGYGSGMVDCITPHRDSESGDESETKGDDGYNPAVIKCGHGAPRGWDSENGDETDTESDPEIGGKEKYGSDGISCPGDTDTEGDSESENGEEGLERWHCIRPIPSPISENQTAHTQRGGTDTKSSGSDAKKSAGKKATGTKRKAEDSPEQTPAKKTKLEEYPGGKSIGCGWPIDRSKRWDIGARTAESRDLSKEKKNSGTKPKGDELPEVNPSKRGKRGGKFSCILPVTPPNEPIIRPLPVTPPKKKSKRSGKIICKLPENPPKKSSTTKRKSTESAKEKSSKKSKRDEEPKRSEEDAGKKVGWLW
ncbi:hypothetical protein V500_03180 [Pseudogymnoascus sp. VKM F-4518 (FW-2643)]|nr:hypothetical protein V500_03180 [Pseudogymnoascus sp. VKM F-4518 (FW-2643)]